jgi:ribosomal protein S18 acetylase RimI-like enzyme
MEDHLKVRTASENDFESLVRLVAAFRVHLARSTPSDANIRQSIATLLKDAGTEFCLAYDLKGAACGYAQIRYRNSVWTSALDAELEDLFVVPEARRRGTGLRLVKFAIVRATERGCRRIGLNTNERNHEALRLYSRLGFVSERNLWVGGRQLWLERPLGME